MAAVSRPLRAPAVARRSQADHGGCRSRRMTVRRVHGAVVALVAAGAVAVVTVPALQHTRDTRDLRAARAAVRHVALPAGADRVRECHGDGVTACAVVRATSTDSLVHALASAVGSASGHAATVRCDPLVVGIAAGQRSCLVAARWGHHGVFAFVEPHVVRQDGKSAVDGLLVSLSFG